MQFKNSIVVRVLITLYLSTESLCHYLPEKKLADSNKKNDSALHRDRIQICGNALTTMIIEACDGVVGSPNQANLSKGSVQTKITEDCCDRECPLDYLQNYCGQTPLFTIKKTVRGRLLSRLNSRNRMSENGNGFEDGKNDKKTVQNEVRINEGFRRKKKGARGRKKRKRSFKWKCAFKSFGNYLLNIGRRNRVHNNFVKRHNNINRTWPSIQIGTISPEIDKFGGQPIVVVKKNKPMR